MDKKNIQYLLFNVLYSTPISKSGWKSFFIVDSEGKNPAWISVHTTSIDDAVVIYDEKKQVLSLEVNNVRNIKDLKRDVVMGLQFAMFKGEKFVPKSR